MMTDTNAHPGLEMLSAYADGELDSAGVAATERHLSSCADCREQLRRVRDLVAAAGGLPREIAPPAGVWTGIRDGMSGRKRSLARRVLWGAGWLAAASLLVVAGTVLLSPGPGRLTKVRAQETRSQPPGVMVSNVEANYAGTVADLRRTLETQRGSLAPSTVRVVEHSLAVIDSAIAEARAALAADPANAVLVEILSAQYELKVDLLQRATKLSPAT